VEANYFGGVDLSEVIKETNEEGEKVDPDEAI